MRVKRGACLLLVLGLAACERKPEPVRSPAGPAPAKVERSPREHELDSLKEVLAGYRRELRYGEALRDLAAFSRSHPEEFPAFEALRSEITAEADRELLRRVEVARNEEQFGEPRRAMERWEAVKALGIDSGIEQAQQAVAALQASQSRKLREAATPQLGEALLELELLLKERRAAEAEALLQRVGEQVPALQHEMMWLRGTVLESHGLFSAVAAGGRKHVGETFELPSGHSKLIGADEKTMTFESGAVPVHDLPPDLLVRFAAAGGITPDYSGQYLLFTGRTAEARRAWRDVPHCDCLDALANAVEAAKAKARER